MLLPTVKMKDLECLVPQATFRVRVQKAEYVEKPKKEGASPYIKLTLVIEDEGEYLGRYVWANYPLSGNGMYRLLTCVAFFGPAET